MPQTITDRDMREQVTQSVISEPGGVSDFDVNAIVETLQERYGLVHIDEIPSDIYWDIVQQHDTSNQEGTPA